MVAYLSGIIPVCFRLGIKAWQQRQIIGCGKKNPHYGHHIAIIITVYIKQQDIHRRDNRGQAGRQHTGVKNSREGRFKMNQGHAIEIKFTPAEGAR